MTIAGKSYSTPKNINLKDGILRFNVSKTANPLSLDSVGWGLYVNSSNQLVFWNKTATTVLGSGGSGSTPTWETIFAADNTFTINPDATFTIAGNRATATDVLTFTNAVGGSGDVVKIQNSGTGADISGTSDTWTITNAGVITATGLTLSGDHTITSLGNTTWTLEDNEAAALDIGASGATEILRIVTTNGSEAVVFGNNITLTDGLFTATSTSNTAPLFLLQNDTITDFGNGTTEDEGAFVFSSDTLSTGDLIRLQLDESELAGGAFLKCVQTDGATAVFTLGENGAITIAGEAAATDAITVTAGDLTLTDGHLVMTEGDATLTLGDLTLTAGDATLTLGDLTLTEGDFTMTEGDAVLSDGSLAITDADAATSFSITNNSVATADLVSIASTGCTDGAMMKINANAATHDGEILELISAGDATSTPTGLSITMPSITTGAAKGISLVMAGATTHAVGITVDMAALTTGTGQLITTAGVMTTTGELISLVANAATTSTGLLRASGTGLTDGWVAEFTGGGANFTANGGMVNLAMGAATAGTGIKLVTTGIYIGTTGLIDINATQTTTGTIIDILNEGRTTGDVLKITTNTTGTGNYIHCYDGAATDFKVSRYGAVTIAGNATGTDALTLTAGDITVTDGDITITEGDFVMTLGSQTITAGNLTLTAGTIIETPQAILNANTAISVTHGVTKIANDAASTHTLADGVEGQRKTIICTVYVGDAVISPDSFANGSTITLNAALDAVTLVFLGTDWHVETTYGTTAIA